MVSEPFEDVQVVRRLWVILRPQDEDRHGGEVELLEDVELLLLEGEVELLEVELLLLEVEVELLEDVELLLLEGEVELLVELEERGVQEGIPSVQAREPLHWPQRCPVKFSRQAQVLFWQIVNGMLPHS